MLKVGRLVSREAGMGEKEVPCEKQGKEKCRDPGGNVQEVSSVNGTLGGMSKHVFDQTFKNVLIGKRCRGKGVHSRRGCI